MLFAPWCDERDPTEPRPAGPSSTYSGYVIAAPGGSDVAPRLGVIVISHNSAACLPALLDSIPAALGGSHADVVVVDNGSRDHSVALVSERADCRVVAADNGGYASGINVGVSETPDVEAWLVLNPDLTCNPGSIAALAAGLATPGVGIVGPRVLSPDGELQPSMRREPTLLRNMGLSFTHRPELSEYVSDPEEYSRDRDADWILGAALMFSRECLDRVGAWDETFFLYSEETDFCLRASDAGLRTRYIHDSTMVHEGGGSGQSGATHAMQILNRVRLYGRRHSRPATLAYYALTVLSEVSWLARGANKSRASFVALVRPSLRPPELRCSDTLLPT